VKTASLVLLLAVIASATLLAALHVVDGGDVVELLKSLVAGAVAGGVAGAAITRK